jgi:hypothetical protein
MWRSAGQLWKTLKIPLVKSLEKSLYEPEAVAYTNEEDGYSFYFSVKSFPNK